MAQTDTAGQLSWLLDNLVNQVEHVEQAVILSRDGLVVAASRGLTGEDGEHLSALAAGVQSLARGAGRHFHGGEVRQTIIEMEQAFLFVIAAGKGTCLERCSHALPPRRTWALSPTRWRLPVKPRRGQLPPAAEPLRFP